MKKITFIFCAVLLLNLATVLASPKEIFKEDFEDYVVGNFLPQYSNAIVYKANFKTNFSYVVDYGTMDSQCLRVTKKEGSGINGGVWLPINTTDNMFSDDGIITVRFKCRPSTNLGGFMLGNGTDRGRALWGYRNGGKFYLVLKQSGETVALSGFSADRDNKFEIKILYPAKRLCSVIINGVTNTPTIILNNYKASHFGVAIFCEGYVATSNPFHSCVDDIQVLYEPLATEKRWSDEFSLNNENVGPDAEIGLMPEDEISYSTKWVEGVNREVLVNAIYEEPPMTLSYLIFRSTNDGEEGKIQWNYLDDKYVIPLDTFYDLKHTIKSGNEILSEESARVFLLPEPLMFMSFAFLSFLLFPKIRKF